MQYDAPAKMGSLTIIGYENFTLILTSEKGASVYFDGLGSRFVDSLDNAEDPLGGRSAVTPVPYPAP